MSAAISQFNDIVRRSFTDKLSGADIEVRKNYNTIKNTLLSYKGVKSKISSSCDTFRAGKVRIAKIKVTMRHVMVCLALDPNAPEYNTGTLPHEDMSAKKAFEEVPFRIKVQSSLSVRRTIAAIEDLAEKLGLEGNADYEIKNFADNPTATIV